jgi:CrcB protein
VPSEPAALTVTTALAVAAGTALGALLRYALSEALNRRFPQLPPGTLAANLLGALAAGAAASVAATAATAATVATAATAGLAPGTPAGPGWWAFGVIGVLGGLTTFSAFSAEVVGQWRARARGWAATAVVAHTAGAVAMAAAGWALARAALG